MTNLVDSDEIEKIVGIERRAFMHHARAVSEEQVVYILHSEICVSARLDLRDCPYSKALDNGILEDDWSGKEDQPVWVVIREDRLCPVLIPNIDVE